MRAVLLAASILCLSACVSYPDAVKVEEGTNLVSFEQVSAPDSDFNKQAARWSGVIAEVKNLKSSTQIDVLYYPASNNGRPITKEEPIGRFRVYSDKFLDPAIYKQGKAITALGTVSPKETAKIGEFEYEYPTLRSATVYLWPKVKPRTQVEFYYGWYGPSPRWYWHGGARHIYVIGQGRKAPDGKQGKKGSSNTPNP